MSNNSKPELMPKMRPGYQEWVLNQYDPVSGIIFYININKRYKSWQNSSLINQTD